MYRHTDTYWCFREKEKGEEKGPVGEEDEGGRKEEGRRGDSVGRQERD